MLASLVRDLKQEYNGNRGAQFFDSQGELADHVVNYLHRRAEAVTEDRAVGEEVRSRLQQRLDHWELRRHTPGAVLGYRAARRQGEVSPLLKEPDGSRWQLMSCPTSLREVEPPIRLLFHGDATGADISSEPPFVPRPQPEGQDDNAQEMP
ncbi:hypothetical protein ACWV95_22640 [Streptomyces albus]